MGQDVEIAWGELRREGATKMQRYWYRVFRANSINTIVPKKSAPKTCEIYAKRWAMGHTWELVRGWGIVSLREARWNEVGWGVARVGAKHGAALTSCLHASFWHEM